MSFHCKNLQAFILQSHARSIATCTIVVYTHSDQHLIPGLARFTIHEPARICWRCIHLLDQGSAGRELQCTLSPVPLIPDPSESASILHRTSPISNGSGISCCPVQAGTLIPALCPAKLTRDLNYSGSIPTATTLIPDPLPYLTAGIWQPKSCDLYQRGSGISSGGVMLCHYN